MTSEGASAQSIADHVLGLEGELEAAGTAILDDAEVEGVRAALRKWVDSVVGAVASPALGRVTLIHANGRSSTVNSSDLSYALSRDAARTG